MATLDDLTTWIQTRIQTAASMNGSAPNLAGANIVVDDDKDISTAIAKALAQIGMSILIGQPVWKNTATELSPNSILEIEIDIAVGEEPVLWRKTPNRPKAKDVTILLIQLLHNQKIPGFVNLKVGHGNHVPSKKYNLYEVKILTSMVISPLP